MFVFVFGLPMHAATRLLSAASCARSARYSSLSLALPRLVYCLLEYCWCPSFTRAHCFVRCIISIFNSLLSDVLLSASYDGYKYSSVTKPDVHPFITITLAIFSSAGAPEALIHLSL